MFTDIVGYAKLLGTDERKALTLLHESRLIHETCIDSHGGELLKEMGDGILAQFDSALEAIKCAIDIQQRARTTLGNSLRIGIHLGDVVIEHHDIFGDGVNIASRLQSIADPGGIYISESVEKTIRSRKDIQSRYLGEVDLKNVDYRIKTYALIGEGLAVTSEAKIKAMMAPQSGIIRILKSPLTYLLIAAVSLVLIFNQFWFSDSTVEGVRLIVLPIQDLSGDKNGEFLVAGIHSTIIDEIGKIGALQVISRTTSKKYQDSPKTITEIADELNIALVIESEFLQMDDSVGLQFRLIQVFPEQQLWAKSYSEATTDVMSIYDNVATEISRTINIELSPQEKILLSSAKQVNPDAYKAYLKSQFHYNNFTPLDLNLALQSLDLALKYDPDYLQAYLGIAQMWIGQAQMGLVPYAEAYPKIKAAEEKALSFNILNAEVHNMQAGIKTFVEWEWEAGEIDFQKAIALNPNYSDARNIYSYLLAITNRHSEAKIQIDLALELDPFNAYIESLYSWNMLYARQYDKALEHSEKSLKLAPMQWVAQDAMRQAYHMLGRLDEALEVTKELYTDYGIDEVVKAIDSGFKQGGYTLAMNAGAQALASYYESNFVSPESIAEMYAYAGNHDQVLEWLEEAYRVHDNDIHYLAVAPIYDGLRDEPRFQELVRKINLPQKED